MSAFDAYIQSKFAEVQLYREQMHSYQTELAIPFLREKPFSALFMDMGLGKSVTSATLIADLLMEFATKKVLVVGPLRVMTDTWPNEFRKWQHLAPFNFTLIREDDYDPRIKEARKKDRAIAEEKAWERDRLKALGHDDAEIQRMLGATHETKVRHQLRVELAHSKTSIHFINREQLVWLVNLFGPKWPYRTVFIDESDSFKDHGSERFKALAKIRRTPGAITRMHLLSATPDSEGVHEYWAQIYLLDLGKRLGKNITAFRREYQRQNAYTKQWETLPGAEEKVLEKIGDIALVMRAKDYLDLEEPNIVPHYVSLPAPAMEMYREMRDECVVEIDGRKIEAEMAAALTGKLQQIASGVLYETYEIGDWETEDITKVKKVHHVHDAKIETLREIHEGLHHKPLIVVYHFKATLDRLRKAFPKGMDLKDKEYTQAKWDKGKIPMLFVHPASGGHGLNLQYGCCNMVIFDIPWPLRLYLQVIGRIARQGQKIPVLVQLLIAKGTVDEDAWGALRNKEDGQERRRAILQRFIREHRKRRNASEGDPL